MTVISNYVDGIKTFGEAEEIVEHYAELNNDPTGCYQIILKMLHIKSKEICPKSSRFAILSL